MVNGDGTATIVLASQVFVSVFFYTWHEGNMVSVLQGPSVGQVRRLVSVADDNVTIVVDAPFDPPLGPDDILSITSYRGKHTFEGNSYHNGTCFSYYGGFFDSIMSGNTLDEMFWTTPVDSMGWHEGLVNVPVPYQGGNVGGGGGGGRCGIRQWRRPRPRGCGGGGGGGGGGAKPHAGLAVRQRRGRRRRRRQLGGGGVGGGGGGGR